jgi:hypothetical protein
VALFPVRSRPGGHARRGQRFAILQGSQGSEQRVIGGHADDGGLALAASASSVIRNPAAYWLGDSAVHVHALARLIAQAEQLLPQAVHDARDQELT